MHQAAVQAATRTQAAVQVATQAQVAVQITIPVLIIQKLLIGLERQLLIKPLTRSTIVLHQIS
ncbi:hypothetical protein LbDm2_1259 [Levilactobacillus brevis]|nr:hypothetical protein LbDm2_1259 [Levilactobacillus brevis]